MGDRVKPTHFFIFYPARQSNIAWNCHPFGLMFVSIAALSKLNISLESRACGMHEWLWLRIADLR